MAHQSIASALSAYLAASPPFDWQASNCVQFAAGWVQLIERRQVQAPGALGLADARRMMRRWAGSLGDCVTRELAREPVPTAAARPGDVVLIERDGGQTLGICAGRTAAVLTAAGVAHIPMQAAQSAWHIKAAPCATR